MEIGGRDYINTGSFKKYIQTLVRRTSSDFKTPQNTLLRTITLDYYFEGISADKMLSLQYNRIKQFFVC